MDIIDPHLSKEIEVKTEDRGDGTYYIQYKPVSYGKHTINIKFGGQHIAKSPFHVNVLSSRKDPVPSKVKAFGPGEYKKTKFKNHSVFILRVKHAYVQVSTSKLQLPSQ